MVKLYDSELAVQIDKVEIQAHRDKSFLLERYYERSFRSAKTLGIVEMRSEIYRLINPGEIIKETLIP